MEVFENRHTTAMRLGHEPVKLVYDCPKKCGSYCRFRLGLSIATYMSKFRGRMEYRLFVGKGFASGTWTNIEDNTEVFADYEGFCDGHIELQLVCGGGLAAMWLSEHGNACVVIRGGDTKKACFSLTCKTEKEYHHKSDETSSLKIAGIVRTMNVHGGVRRYFEMGNALMASGNSYTLYAITMKEKTPWVQFMGKQMPHGAWKNEEHDIVLTGDWESFSDLCNFPAKKKVVMVVAKFYAEKYLKLWREQGEGLKWVGVASDWNKGMEEIKGVCIPGGVNTNFFTPVMPMRGRKPIVAFYARAGEGRGVEKVIALANLLKYEADFIGFDFPGYPLVSGLPSNMRIELTPTQESLRSVLQKADIVVSAMRSAGWNNVAAEGAACGCIPIVTEAGTKDIVLHGRTGFMCDSTWFERQAAEYIKELIKNPDLMDRIANRASQWVKQFDWNIVAERFLTEVVK